ncbi:ferritin-like domain-containing protein [Sorangium sp. So ce388]|uniref:ferritin-like domain-containing protein n=1 Tax=Sorangium sp. So ce388 TaxID=3133309 RepID=UPI003F5CBAF0
MRTVESIHIDPVHARDPKNLSIDASALRALAQAAVTVELFTIPLYMVPMYSIQGMHPINASEQTFYKGRRWPGSAPTHAPESANERAFNIIFSVFVQEMLHLQLAANLATSMGVTPTFTSSILQTEDDGWKCFGPDNTVIPHIIDLRDTTTHASAKVVLGPLSAAQIELFLAVEAPENQARQRIDPQKLDKYFPAVPFAGWTPDQTEADLPMFGTIGYMYECMVHYMTMRYRDGTTLWQHVYAPSSVQRELFNTPTGGHPMPEYPGIPAVLPTIGAEEALGAAVDIISAITDQGEGRTITPPLRAVLLGHREALASLANEVATDYRSSEKGLTLDYPSYDDDGKLLPSADAKARFDNDRKDHYARFLEIREELLPHLVTWDAWHASRGAAPWTARDLTIGDTDEASDKVPRAADVAAALNRLKARNADGSVRRQLSQVAAGAIAGVTRALDGYWKDPNVGFPYPSMVGSGDRVSICWAVLGEAPDLALGTEQPRQGALYHACQGLDLAHPGSGEMPAITTYHTCKGSNACKAQGGCGFVQSVAGGGSCRGGGGGGATSCGTTIKSQASCGHRGMLYSAPTDNKCGALGGCAVPISASQLYPSSGEMALFDIGPDAEPRSIGTMPFAYGDPVYDVAWRAYCEVLRARGETPPSAPPPADDLRVAFPPST